MNPRFAAWPPRRDALTGPGCRAAGLLAVVTLLLAGCRTVPQPGAPLRRTGDEIVAAGQFFHTGTPVVLWMDPGGYDAYRVERRFSAWEEADWEHTQEKVRALGTPNRYGLRQQGLKPEELEQIRGGGWDLARLRGAIDQFVIHFDACGTSRQCFKVLHDLRGLSVHFLLDLDGTLYQTLDLKERAWHATTSNTRSIGIEIAQIGAYPLSRTNLLAEWYQRGPDGRTRITIPAKLGEGGVRARRFVGRPAREQPVTGAVQGIELAQYDYTPQQYRALARLTATLCRIFPAIRCDYPRDEAGALVPHRLAPETLERFQGILGHFHIQTNKVDPGPAFQWDAYLRATRRALRRAAR